VLIIVVVLDHVDRGGPHLPLFHERFIAAALRFHEARPDDTTAYCFFTAEFAPSLRSSFSPTSSPRMTQ
jgi:hypothetical protein